MKINKIVKLLSPSALLPLITLSTSCDERDEESIYQSYKNVFLDIDTFEITKGKDFSIEDNKINKILLAKEYFLNDLILYRDLKNTNDAASKSIMYAKITENFNKIENLLEAKFNQEKFSYELQNYDELSDQIKSLLKSVKTNFHLFFYVLDNLFTATNYYYKLALEDKNTMGLELVNSQLSTLIEFSNALVEDKKLENAFKANNKIEIIKQIYNDDKVQLNANLAQVNSYYEYDLIDLAKQLEKYGNEVNNLSNYWQPHFLNIEYNILYQKYLLFLSNLALKRVNTYNQNIVNFELDGKINQYIDTIYPANYIEYQKVYDSYLKLTDFIYEIGPQSSLNLKKLGLLDQTEAWTKNLSKANKEFKSWLNKLNKKAFISINDNFKHELPFHSRLHPEKIIWTNLYNDLSKHYKNFN
ncbi:hypothetical protein [Mycoplasma simbae]|uniref:hypothetical protein n=1 Tax=Mycoplasma simbae TaxID=36744 RepID=UPI000497DB6C|nr:hypothetical protein [Mycoplasma simbae]